MSSREAAWLRALEKQDAGSKVMNWLFLCFLNEIYIYNFPAFIKKTDCTTIFFQPLFTIHIQSCGNGRVEARICCPNTAAAQGYQLVLQTHDYREMGRRRQERIVRWVTTADQDQGFFSKVRGIILVLILLLPVKGCTPDSQEGSSASFVCKTMLHSKLNS